LKTILIIVGTHPEIIKTAPVVLAAQNQKYVQVRYCLTGQHAKMVFEILTILKIQSDIQFCFSLMFPAIYDSTNKTR
jgi:UDP-N-acetylglucosamine 2-epimerase (non-hydrolysing)